MAIERNKFFITTKVVKPVTLDEFQSENRFKGSSNKTKRMGPCSLFSHSCFTTINLSFCFGPLISMIPYQTPMVVLAI